MSMKAFTLTPDGPRIRQQDEPRLGPEEVLIAVRACALNRVDLAMRQGATHGRSGGLGATLGVECAGEVVQIGAAVRGIHLGDRVMSAGAGAFAEYRAVDALCVLPVPTGMSYEEAATLPIA